MKNRKIILIIHNVRSAQNVGGLLRTADGLAVTKVFMAGYTPYPKNIRDERLPHESKKVAAQIHKTALGAEDTVDWEYKDDVLLLLANLKELGYEIVALEQTNKAKNILEYRPFKKIVLIVGNELTGLDAAVLQKTDQHIQLPMQGKKESFNVVVAAAMALYHIRFIS